VLGDVGHPQLIWAGAGELTLNQIAGGGLGSQATPELGAARHALEAGAAQPAAPSAWSPTVMPWPKVRSAWIRRLPLGLAGGGIHLADHVGEPGVADGPRRRRPAAPGE
jgi:hypothetical protein